MPPNLLVATFRRLQESSFAGLAAVILSIVIKIILVSILTTINKEPIDSNPIQNLLFLIFQRPIFVIGEGLAIMPFILKNPTLFPVELLLSQDFWFTFSRLSYGAYLSAPVFMLFRNYNTERGIWASEIDSFLFFMAYLSLAFMFSLFATLAIEYPCLNLYREFVLKLPDPIYTSFKWNMGKKPVHDEARKGAVYSGSSDDC